MNLPALLAGNEVDYYLSSHNTLLITKAVTGNVIIAIGPHGMDTAIPINPLINLLRSLGLLTEETTPDSIALLVQTTINETSLIILSCPLFAGISPFNVRYTYLLLSLIQTLLLLLCLPLSLSLLVSLPSPC